MFVKNKSGNLLVGRVARDPEERTFNSGKSKVSFSVLYADDSENLDEHGRAKGLFLQVDAWGAVGRDALMLQKGDFVIALGRIDKHEYNDKVYTSLVADAVWGDISSQMRIIAHGSTSDAPGCNASDLKAPPARDPFESLSDDDGELPF